MQLKESCHYNHNGSVQPTLTQQEFNLFSNFISSRSGLQFDETRREALETSLLTRIAAIGVNSFFDYYDMLQSSGDGERELKELLNLLVVNETYFFRYPEQFVVLRERILPELIRRRNSGNRDIRILSAGCSTGEEPYSIAMTLRMAMSLDDEWAVSILATDISERALSIARRAIYGKRSLKLVSPKYLDMYFEKHSKDAFRVREKIQEMVLFKNFNLAERGNQNLPKNVYDIIFCRNVVIYFDMETMKRAIGYLYSALDNGGYLFTGHSEIPNRIIEGIRPYDVSGTFIYVKDVKCTRNRQKVATLAANLLPRKTPLQRISAPRANALDHGETNSRAVDDSYRTAEGKLKSELDTTDSQSPLSLAELYANCGDEEKAIAECKRVLQTNPLSSDTYFLIGVLYSKRGEKVKAIDAFRKATYLDQSFSIAYFHLAEIYATAENWQEALKGYKNALRGVMEHGLDETIKYSGGFTNLLVAQLCEEKIILCEQKLVNDIASKTN